jgi:two-component system response regulator DegU
MIRLLIVDDHRMFADALSLLLDSEDGVRIVGISNDAESALALVDAERPDVVLMDVDLPRMNGIIATQALVDSYPDVRVIVITALMDAGVVEEAARAGATGFVSKQRAAEDLLRAVHVVAAGEEFFRLEELSRIGRRAGATAKQEHRMTSREREILQGLADGLSTDELAAALFLSRRTVESHVQNILTKLNLRSKLEAVLYGLRHGIVLLKSEDDRTMPPT